MIEINGQAKQQLNASHKSLSAVLNRYRFLFKNQANSYAAPIMLRLIIINVLIFVFFIVIFILAAFVIGVAMNPGNHDKETGATYVGITFLHIYINQRLLKKQKLESLRHKTVSTILILAAYIGYLFLYR